MNKKVYAMYFSGTGTTEKMVTYLAKKLASALNAELQTFDFTLPCAREDRQCFTKEDIVLLGTPVIAGRIPNLLLKYLNTIQGNGALGIPIVLFGNRNFDDALIELGNIMKNNAFHVIAGGAFVGEHSFSTILGQGRPDAEDFKVADTFINAVTEKMKSKNLSSIPVILKGERPIRPYYTPRDRNGKPIDIRKVKPKTNHHCNKCGLCASICPLGSIDMLDYSNITGICMKCCACIKKCPNDAKYFDDEGYLYHKTELEEVYGIRRAENEWFI